MTEETSTATAEQAAAPDKPKRQVRVPGAVTAAAPANAGATDDPDAGLPNAIDIDAFKIKAPVLTRQGWVVPPDFGQPVGKR